MSSADEKKRALIASADVAIKAFFTAMREIEAVGDPLLRALRYHAFMSQLVKAHQAGTAQTPAPTNTRSLH